MTREEKSQEEELTAQLADNQHLFSRYIWFKCYNNSDLRRACLKQTLLYL